MRLRTVSAALAVVMLAACTSVPVRAPLQTVELAPEARAAALARLESREAAVRALPELAFEGRVAMSNGRDGGSGRIEWQQNGAAYRVTLSAPVTRQSWELQGDGSGARLDGLQGGPRADADVGALLRDATGFEIPVAAMAAWAAGTRADASAAGVADIAFDAGGQLARLQQDGWTIDYVEWQPEPASAGVPALPTRINAQRGEARVRLIVDRWATDAVESP